MWMQQSIGYPVVSIIVHPLSLINQLKKKISTIWNIVPFQFYSTKVFIIVYADQA